MSIEQTINYHLNKYPAAKKIAKRFYQHIGYLFSPKLKSTGNITQLSPDDSKHEYFFGYYDKSPWDRTDRHLLCLRVNHTWQDVNPRETADILLIDTEKSQGDCSRIKKLATTRTWNVQQGCMLQWLGPDFSSKIIYNDYRQGHYVSVILDIHTGQEQIIEMSIYTVSADGRTALTLDFSRLYNLRPGYGYYNAPETTQNVALPDTTAIWKIDLETGNILPLLTYKDFALFNPRPEMQSPRAVHKVNHLMLSPNGKRFMVLYRWFVSGRKYTRLITCNTDGSDMYLLLDDDMVSHCCWKNDQEILAFANQSGKGSGYYLLKDKTSQIQHCWSQLTGDGHPSYSPTGDQIVTDSYPNRSRIQQLYVMRGENAVPQVLAKVFAPFKYDNDTRCDLHPRWNHQGTKVCFDSVFEGKRGLYSVDIPEQTNQKITVCFLMTSCKKCGPVQQMLNIIKYLDKENFNPILVTIYPEPTDGSSQLPKYLNYVKHYYIPIGKLAVITGRTKQLKELLNKIKPDIIHSLGVFPDYAVSRMKRYRQLITLRNFVWEDYPVKFGKVRGSILAKLHLYAMQHTTKTVTCSQSLSTIYREKLQLSYDFIRNGVDVEQYTKSTSQEMLRIRHELKLPSQAFIFVYSGQMIDRKNQRFLLEVFRDNFKQKDVYLLLLGDGADYEKLRADFGNIENIDFRGNVTNVEHYLKACNAYVSTSKSEGMPNGVLEAMAVGLPVVLSDIIQHQEIMQADSNIGFTYKQGDKSDLSQKMKQLLTSNWKLMGETAYQSAHKNFSASGMSENYQQEYSKLSQK